MLERILKSSGRTWLAVPSACLVLTLLAVPLKGDARKTGEVPERPQSFQDLITSTTMLKPQPAATRHVEPANGAHNHGVTAGR